jgi:hypothetical protein
MHTLIVYTAEFAVAYAALNALWGAASLALRCWR